jgi:hypothetical protein
MAAVQGIHRARASLPRLQDAGFGYLVAALVEEIAGGERVFRKRQRMYLEAPGDE